MTVEEKANKSIYLDDYHEVGKDESRVSVTNMNVNGKHIAQVLCFKKDYDELSTSINELNNKIEDLIEMIDIFEEFIKEQKITK